MSNPSDLAPILPDTAHAPRSGYVDFVFGLDYLSINAPLLKIIHQTMSNYGLSCLLINDSSVAQSLAAVRKGSLRPLVYLDLCSSPGGIYMELLHAMAGAGASSFCDPSTLKWTLKAYTHPILEAAGLPMPPSVIFKKDDPDRELTAEERARVGDKCVIKPAFGVAGLGVVIGVEPTKAEIAKAREYKRSDDWLVQKKMKWIKFGDRTAYLRGYNVLGYRTLMWWNNDTGYTSLTWDDLRKYDLMGAVDIIDRIVAITGVQYFSSEIAITAESGPDRFCLIDYINDQCDIDPSAQPDRSPPESWVRWVVERFAEFTWRKKHGMAPAPAGTLYLAD